jgi:GT2 family glycosyltransferase
MNYRSRWSGIFTGDQAIFVRRDIFKRLGGFADIPLMEDIDFSTRLKRAGPTEALRETVVTSFRRWEQQGTLKTILLMWTLRFLYWMGVSPHRLKTFYATVR